VKGPIVERHLELGGLGTRALELDGEGPPLLLLHGFADSADCWRPLLDRLRKRSRAAVALDMPGFGAAAHLRRGEDLLPQLDAFVADAVAHAASDRGTVVVGNSLGGAMALRAAEKPELPIEGIAPIAPAGLDMARWLRIIEGAPLMRGLLGTPFPVPEPVVRQVVGRLYLTFAFAHPRSVDTGAVKSFASHIGTKRDARRILATGHQVIGELTDCFELEKISCPVLVLWGERDRMVYSSGADHVIGTVKGSRLELIEDCGHCPQVEAPDRVAELLDEFLDLCSAGEPRLADRAR
jgi:pimeloyl-ACP methyl ester carboxylesterase